MEGKEIKRLRKAARLTQWELAEIVGVVQSTIADWERGIKRPKRSLVKRLRVVLCQLEDLFTPSDS
jgi:DNA-binding transcriptional regulator YiaG